MEKFCDLHTHSVFSDGTCTPTEIVDAAVGLGLSAVALCDHNTADGLPEFLQAAAGKPIEAVAGVEFSTDYRGTELHLLALYVPEGQFAAVGDLMEGVNSRKEQSNLELVRALNGAGYAISFEQIRASTPNGKFNRAHVAAELTRLGYTRSNTEAFQTLLDPRQGYYRPPERLAFLDMIGVVASIGAVPVLAHPLLDLSREALEDLLPQAKARGLVGMECFYSTYSEEETALSLALAERYGLKPSGGSDFHGTNKPDIRLGTGRGGLQIPAPWAHALRPG